MKENGKEDLLQEDNFMLVVMEIPKNAVEVKLDCNVYHNGNIQNMIGFFGLQEIRELRNKYLQLDPTDDAFVFYHLTSPEEDS